MVSAVLGAFGVSCCLSSLFCFWGLGFLLVFLLYSSCCFAFFWFLFLGFGVFSSFVFLGSSFLSFFLFVCLDLVGVWVLILSLLGEGVEWFMGVYGGFLGLMSFRGPLGFFSFLFFFCPYCFSFLLVFLSLPTQNQQEEKKEQGLTQKETELLTPETKEKKKEEDKLRRSPKAP